ncbi:MAG: MHYT domain-containing protein [Candidatus Acidiferrum sp.]
MIPAETTLTGSYDPLIVALSVVIAVASSYAAIDLGGRVTANKGWFLRGMVDLRRGRHGYWYLVHAFQRHVGL